MTETFEVGQKVKAFGMSEGEITYGPFSSTFGGYTAYVVRIAGVEKLHKAAELAAIPETPKFTVGDVVTLATRAGKKATVEYGPFDDRDVYVVKLVDAPTDADNPQTFTAMAHVMTKVVEPEPIKVGDRVRVVKDDPRLSTGEFVGKIGVVSDIGNYLRDDLKFRIRFHDGSYWWVESVERVEDENAHTYDGVTYDLTAKYRDREGDVWGLKRVDGVVRARMVVDGVPNSGSFSLNYVANSWGPLTRVDA